MKNNYIFLIVGESGTGKTTISELIEQKYGLKQIQSYTTRKPRYDEETGHTFVSKDKFDKLKDIVAYRYYCGNEYGATAKQINESDLYVVDPIGIQDLLKNYKGNKIIKIIYLYSPMWIRAKRMEQRGDKFTDILERITNDATDFKDMKDIADKIINTGENITIERCANEIYKYIIELNEV